MLLLGSPAVAAQLPVQPLAHVPNALRGRYDVERRWNRATFLEIADPQLAHGELPFDVGTFLIRVAEGIQSLSDCATERGG